MDIDVHNDLLFFVLFANQFSHEENLRLRALLTRFPFPVQVAAIGRKPVVSSHDSIGIQHRHYLKQIFRTQHFAKLVVCN